MNASGRQDAVLKDGREWEMSIWSATADSTSQLTGGEDG
jgi:hypothetical protein